MDDIYNRFTSSGSLSETTAMELALPVQIAAKDNDSEAVEAALHKLWKQVLTAAEQTPPEQQAYLVELVAELKNLDGGSFDVWNEPQSWQQLPLLGPAMRDRWSAIDKIKPAWPNINAFAARLTAADVYDLSLHCIWTLRETLEEPNDEALVFSTGPGPVKAVIAWIEYALEKLTSWSQEGKAFDGKLAKPGRSLAHNEWRGFCEDRRYEWARRLDLLAAKRKDLTPLLSTTLEKVRRQ
ncbi:hypothetical protein HDK77DRAFT_481929 [Phyllosticta capitalensis]